MRSLQCTIHPLSFVANSTPDIGFNRETRTGKMFNYFTFGAAVTEVEIDCLTGDHQVRRSQNSGAATFYLPFPLS